MKKLILICALIIAFLSSCYKDNATFTVEIGGGDETYVISYKGQDGNMKDNVTVPNGFQYYNEYSDDFRLTLSVTGSNIEVKVYKRASLIKTYTGTGTLLINEVIQQ